MFGPLIFFYLSCLAQLAGQIYAVNAHTRSLPKQLGQMYSMLYNAHIRALPTQLGQMYSLPTHIGIDGFGLGFSVCVRIRVWARPAMCCVVALGVLAIYVPVAASAWAGAGCCGSQPRFSVGNNKNMTQNRESILQSRCSRRLYGEGGSHVL